MKPITPLCAALLICLLSSCGFQPENQREYRITNPEQADKIAKYTADLCEKSNPKSDEEPEDMIKQAQKTALETYGVRFERAWDSKKGTWGDWKKAE
jgi:hypothetical protein